MTRLILRSPRVTEKATSLGVLRKYVFNVDERATAPEVKKAVKQFYRADVDRVHMIRIKGKARRFRGLRSVRSGYKKAVVTLREGQVIESLAQ